MKRALVALVLLLATPVYAGFNTQAFFTAYNIASTSYVYNEDAGTGANTAWVNAKGLRNKVIVVDVNTINATSLDIRIEARWEIGGDDANGYTTGEIFTRSYTATTDVGDIIVLPELGDEIRVGLKLTADGGAQDIDIYLATEN